MSVTGTPPIVNFQMQESFWKNLQQLKYAFHFLSFHSNLCVKASYAIKNVPIGATFVFTTIWIAMYQFLWTRYVCGIIILLIQVFSALSYLFPFENRKNELRDMTIEIDKLYIEMENDWRKIANGELDDTQINDLIGTYQSKQSDILNHYLKNDIIPENETIEEKARKKTHEYFKNMI